jgi:hypothetical protein
MLPGYPDCGGRAAAKQFRPLIEKAGFTLRKLPPSIGAACGTAVHAAVQELLIPVMDGEPVGSLDEAVAQALLAFREEIRPGAEWDDTTPNLLTAEFQIRRMAQAYLTIAGGVVPDGIEFPLEMALDSRWKLTGTIDLYTAEPALDDLKTGALMRPYQAQLGGYKKLLNHHGFPVKTTRQTFIKRARKTKPQPPAERLEYDPEVCERAADSIIGAIVRDTERFERTGDPYAFPRNPMSLMCSRRYCPAHGTDFCKLHHPEPAGGDLD